MSIYVFTPTGVVIGNWIYVTANGDKLFVHGLAAEALTRSMASAPSRLPAAPAGLGGRAEATSRSSRLPRFPAETPVVAYSDVLYNGTISYPGEE